MIYTHTLESFNLYSEWKCKASEKNGSTLYFIVEGPNDDRKTLDFPVSLPLDAVIVRAWVSAIFGSPLTGAAAKKVNDVSFAGDNTAEVMNINAATKTFSATFLFRANGAVYKDEKTHSATMTVREPTLHIEYTSESENAPEIDENAPGNINRDGFDGGRLPRLLDENLQEKARLEPDLVSLEINLYPLSTATIELSVGQPEVNVRDFVELFSPDGSVGIFRVTETSMSYGNHGKQVVYLEQALTTLADDVTVGIQAMSGTFRQIISTLLEVQSVKRWVVGDVELPDDYEFVYQHSTETVLQAITKLMQYMPEGYALELDTMQYPWVMHLRNYGEDAFCECRLNRNLTNAQVNMNTDNLCTRVYPYGAGEGEDRINLATLTGALYEDAETKDIWGVVTKTFTNDDIFDSITLQDVARRYLDKYKNPTVSVTMDALSLYAATGETLDKFTLGRICRMPLPKYGVTLNERVIALSYQDVYGSPEAVVVTLANKIKNASDEMAELIREANNSKLLGGTVETKTITDQSGDHTTSDPKEKYFDIATYGNLLAARVSYTCLNITDSASAKCSIVVDGQTVQDNHINGYTADIFPYLNRDENGIPTVGEHFVRLTPRSSVGDEHRIWLTITLKTIERK